ncbi:Gfo/Idh/MocA family protein [Rudaeicoccus suwonensis]
MSGRTLTGNNGLQRATQLKTLNVGIIGLGNVARVHAQLIQQRIDGVQVSGVFSARATTRSAFAIEFGAKEFDTAADLVFSEDVDAVLVTSPDMTHEEYVSLCLKAGKPVLCEKPLTPSAEGSKRLLEQELALGRRLVSVGFMRRYDSGYRRMRTLIADDAIGVPKIIHSIHRNPAPSPGFAWQDGITAVAVHDIDIIGWLLGERIASIAAATTIDENSDQQTEPLLLSGTTAGGVLFSIESFVNCGYGYDIGCEVAGTLGSVNLAWGDGIAVRRDYASTKPIPNGYASRFESAFVDQMRAWCEAVRVGHRVGASLWDGYVASLVTDAALRAALSGRSEVVTYPGVPEMYQL